VIRLEHIKALPHDPRDGLAEVLAFWALSFAAAAAIRFTCRAENCPAEVAQSLPGAALQYGHGRLIGLVGKKSGISAFAIE
jgi:hypothetical protein